MRHQAEAANPAIASLLQLKRLVGRIAELGSLALANEHATMSDETPEAKPPLTAAEKAAARRLTEEDLKIIDTAILECSRRDWQKLAKVCSRVHAELAARFPVFSYALYAERIAFLADQGLLEAQGDLDYLRFSEVRLPMRS